MQPNNIYQELMKLYPDAHCELIHKNAFELLISVVLSAQTTDKAVNLVTPNLFKQYPTPLALSQGKLSDIEKYIKTIGLYKTKAKNIKELATTLVSKFNSQVPSEHDQLISLNGVGRKTANVVQSVWFNIPAIAVDTHVERVSKRLRLAYQNDSVLKVEQKLMRKFEKKQWNKLHHLLIFFGRYMCTAKNPKCSQCPFKSFCYDYKHIYHKEPLL